MTSDCKNHVYFFVMFTFCDTVEPPLTATSLQPPLFHGYVAEDGPYTAYFFLSQTFTRIFADVIIYIFPS